MAEGFSAGVFFVVILAIVFGMGRCVAFQEVRGDCERLGGIAYSSSFGSAAAFSCKPR